MITILIVDDDLPLRDGLAKYLARRGHRVLVACNGQEALAVAGADVLDLVLTDINMPDMDGIELILQLGEVAPDVPVIAMSGGGLFDKEMLLDSAGALGAARTLEKPFEPQLLDRAIGELLRDRIGPDRV